MNHKLEFDSIQLSFGDNHLLKNIYMCSQMGTVTGLLGRNGCGKSTLMKLVFGALPAEQKSVRIDSAFLGNRYLSRRLIAYLPQDRLIPEYLTIERAFNLSGICIEDVFEDFPEGRELAHHRPSALSAGQLRIFEILLILKSKAMFCLLDEPFTGLMPMYIDRVKAIVGKAKCSKGIVISDHMYRHVAGLSDHLYLMANGQTYYIHDMNQLVSLGYLTSL